MKDYALTIKVRNNYLLTAMRRAGFQTAAELSRASGVRQSEIGELLNLKTIPVSRRTHEWRPLVMKLANFLRCLPEDLFPPQHVHAPLAANTGEIKMSIDDLRLGLAGQYEPPALPDARLNAQDLRAAIAAALLSLTAREHLVLSLRFGLDDFEPKTLEEVGSIIDRDKERVRQIEAKALRKLKHPSQSRRLREWADDIRAAGPEEAARACDAARTDTGVRPRWAGSTRAGPSEP